MDLVFLIAAFLLGGAQDGEAVSVTAHEGMDVKIECVHRHADSNVKYFCKGECRDEDILIRGNKADPKGKYSIRDAGNTFYVMVHRLTVEDSGTYYCGIERVGVDTYNKVILTVNEKKTTTENPMHHAVLSLPVVVPSVISVVVISFVCVITLCLMKHLRAGQRQSKDASSDNVNMTPSVTPAATKPVCSCPGSPPQPPDLGSHLSEKLHQSTLSDLDDCISVNPKTHASQYQHLDLSTLENHVYHSIGGHQGCKVGPLVDKAHH